MTAPTFCPWCHGAGCLVCGRPGVAALATTAVDGGVCLCGQLAPRGTAWPICPDCGEPMCDQCRDETDPEERHCLACREGRFITVWPEEARA